jgi:hypothetical protein
MTDFIFVRYSPANKGLQRNNRFPFKRWRSQDHSYMMIKHAQYICPEFFSFLNLEMGVETCVRDLRTYICYYMTSDVLLCRWHILTHTGPPALVTFSKTDRHVNRGSFSPMKPLLQPVLKMFLDTSQAMSHTQHWIVPDNDKSFKHVTRDPFSDVWTSGFRILWHLFPLTARMETIVQVGSRKFRNFLWWY